MGYREGSTGWYLERSFFQKGNVQSGRQHYNICGEVIEWTVIGIFNLTDILILVIDGFNNLSFPKRTLPLIPISTFYLVLEILTIRCKPSKKRTWASILEI